MPVKKFTCLFVLLIVVHIGKAQDIVHFRISKPYCLLNFLNTCKGDQGSSAGLSSFIAKQDLLKEPAFQTLLAEYKALPLNYNYSREQYPERRLRSRFGSSNDLLVIAAVQSDDLEQFRQKSTGILPNSDQLQLFRLLSSAMPYYDKLVWQPDSARFVAHLEALKKYQSRISVLFRKLNQFYNSSWTADIPFIVTLYPVPGRWAGTAATPHINTLCVGVRLSDTDHDGLAGIVLHEMCHSLYNEQSAKVQIGLDAYFMKDTSRYRSFAYNYFDEGLATACGNGWARESFSNKPDKGEWYHDKYINGYGHALFPVVKEYLAAGKVIDSAFIAAAIKLFAELFPKAPYDYDLLMSNICLYADAESPAE